MGFPLLVKAVLGGGGKGMKLPARPRTSRCCARLVSLAQVHCFLDKWVWRSLTASGAFLESGSDTGEIGQQIGQCLTRKVLHGVRTGSFSTLE